MELVGGADATQDAGDGLAKQEMAELTHATWHKSTWSSFNGNCVEVAELCGERIAVRDTKNHGLGPVLLFDGAAWRSFIDGMKNGRLPV